jgi:PAS domain S-box-containing protein
VDTDLAYVGGDLVSSGGARNQGPLQDAFLVAADRAGVGIVVVQVAPTLRAVFISERCSQFFGLSVAEMLARPPLQLFPPERLAEIGAILATHRAGGLPPPTFESWVRRPDGREVALEFGVGATEVEGQPGSVVFIRDATESVRAKDTLRRSEARWRTLVEAAPDAIVISRNRQIVYANPAAAELLDCDSPGDLLGASFAEFLPEAEYELMGQRIASLHPDRPSTRPQAYKARSRQGRDLVVEVTSVLLDDPEGPAVLGFARDVTEERRLQAQLIRADRLAAMGTMAAGVAHEINNPLGFVTLALDTLQERERAGQGGPADSVSQALLADVRHGLDRIASGTRQLHTFSRADETWMVSPLRATSLPAVLGTVCRMVEREVRGRGKLDCVLGELPRVRGHEAHLEQVFVNLLINAAQALDPARSNGRVEVRAKVEGKRVVVLISDDGVGINPRDLAHVYDPFFTTKPVGTGTGLGLSICHTILQQIGGDIVIESQPGRGTSARVSLAIADEGAAEPVRAPAPRSLTGRKRILVVDDEEALLRLVERGLGRDHDVAAVGSCAEAARHLREGEFDLILLDVRMPDGGGLGLCELIRRERPQLLSQVVLMTGGVSNREFDLAGLDLPILCKPFSLSALEPLLARPRPG